MNRHISSDQVSLGYRGNTTDIYVDDFPVATAMGRINQKNACSILTDLDYDVEMEKYSVSVMKSEEVLYAYHNSQQISMQTGLIGSFSADLKDNDKGFQLLWDCFRDDLNTKSFSDEMIDVMNYLSEKGRFFSKRAELSSFCLGNRSLTFENGVEYGVRVDSKEYSYLMRLNPRGGFHDVCCYCYRRDWLDSHIEKAKRGIRFVDSQYLERFRLDDGDKILIKSAIPAASNTRDCPAIYMCRYIDDYHFEYGEKLCHICDFSERLEESGNVVIPLRASLPIKCYVYIQSENKIGIVEKGESGYVDVPVVFKDSEDAKEFVEINNEKLGVTKAQAEAMKSGSMFGWHTPAADPKNYDKDGVPVVDRSKIRDPVR